MARHSEKDKPHMEEVAEKLLPTIDLREKWSTVQPPLQVGDLV